MIRSLLPLAGALSLTAVTTADTAGWRFPVDNLDPNVSPAQDFYDFAVGGWRKNNPIPPEYARWGVFDRLAADTRDKVHGILEEAATNPAPAGTERRKVGDFYASGMNEAAIEAAGIKPILPDLRRIDAIMNLDDLQQTIVRLQRIGADAVFNFGRMPDPMESSRLIGVADQGGLGLPDPSYYHNTDPRSQAIRDAYAQHAVALLRLAGETQADAQRDAAAAFAIESALAGSSLSRVEQRDPYAIYHMLDRDALAALTPHFSWARYFTLLGRPDIQRIDVTAPRFFGEVDRLLTTRPLADWKAYLRLRLLQAAAPYLTRAFNDERFRFQAKLTGVERQLPRWVRVLRAPEGALGFAVGKLFVERYFTPEAKAKAKTMVDDIQEALRRDLATLDWMGPETRARAREKLDLMTDKIGYPEVWRDYTGLDIDRGSFAENAFRANEFELRRQIGQIGQPTDRTEWEMTPQTVNAYYNPLLNEIVFPAGILQAPFFDPAAPTAWNYGGIGAVIAHEITHGFDDEGSQFDGRGNLNDWWTKEDAERFHARTRCIAEQFSRFTVAGGVHVNGRLVTGEAVADLGGAKLALLGLRARVPDRGTEMDRRRDQLFFLSFANVWASNARPEQEQLLAIVDPHPPPRFRVNGTVSNLPEWKAAFRVPDGSPMVHTPRCEIW